MGVSYGRSAKGARGCGPGYRRAGCRPSRGHCARRHRRECAAFDQLARQAICAYAPSPDAGQGPAEVAALVESELEEALGTSNLAIEVTVQGRAGSYQRYCGRLSFAPTLFGLGLKDEVFGVSLPRLVHEVDLTVDAYRPGVLL